MARTGKSDNTPAPPTLGKRIWLLALGFFVAEIMVLPGAASPFRTPKEVVALSVIIVVVGLSFAGLLARGRLTLKMTPAAVVLLALPLLQAVSVLWSSNPRLAIAAAVSSAVWVAAVLWIATTGADQRRRLVHAAALGAAVSGIVLMIQAVGSAVFAVDSVGLASRLRLTGLTGNPADLAMAAVLMLPLVLAGSAAPTRPWFRWTLAALLTLAAAVSQTLTGFAALSLVWGTWLVQQRSRRLWAAAGAASLLVLAVGLATGLDARIHRQLWRLQRGDWYSLLSARSDGWTAAGEMIRNRPVLGVGASNFSHAYYPSRISWLERTGSIGRRSELATHFDLAHCDPLQMVAELGAGGIFWMIGMLVVLIRHRPRGDPLPWLALAAFAPFALLHFPAHLSVGLIPLALTLGHILAAAPTREIEIARWTRRIGPVVATLVVIVGVYWQFQRMALSVWRGGLDYVLTEAQRLDEPGRSRQASAVEAQILPRIPALAGSRPWLWRIVGQARLIRGDDVGAETAFRTAMTLWPHEEAEFGLGLALAAQSRRIESSGLALDTHNRRGEAVMHLVRVCRTNPRLIELIGDPDLGRSVSEIVHAAEEAAVPAER